MMLQDDGILLHAELSLPQPQPARLPLVILVHGFTGHMEEPHILGVRDAMLEAGFGVLRAELYGHGRSGGEFARHNLYKWVNNLLTLFDYAQGLPFVSGLWLCGHSQGGLAVMLAGAMLRDRIRGILPLSPAWMIPEQAREGCLLGRRFDPGQIPDRIDLEPGRWLSGNYVRVAQAIRVEDAIRQFRGPVLIVHGTGDKTVPYCWSEKAAALYENCELARIEGDTHCFDLHLEQVKRAVRQWLLQQRLCPADGRILP